MKPLTTLALAAALLPLFAWAEFTGPSTQPTVTTVQQAQGAADKVPATLEGYIVRRLDGEHYEFRDLAGATMRVEIDDKVLPATPFGPERKLRLSGKVDKDWSRRELEVKRVELLD